MDNFKRLLRTILFSAYQCNWRIRCVATMRSTNLHFTYFYLLTIEADLFTYLRIIYSCTRWYESSFRFPGSQPTGHHINAVGGLPLHPAGRTRLPSRRRSIYCPLASNLIVHARRQHQTTWITNATALSPHIINQSIHQWSCVAESTTLVPTLSVPRWRDITHSVNERQSIISNVWLRSLSNYCATNSRLLGTGLRLSSGPREHDCMLLLVASAATLGLYLFNISNVCKCTHMKETVNKSQLKTRAINSHPHH